LQIAKSETKFAVEKQGALMLSLSISRQNIHPVSNGGDITNFLTLSALSD